MPAFLKAPNHPSQKVLLPEIRPSMPALIGSRPFFLEYTTFGSLHPHAASLHMLLLDSTTGAGIDHGTTFAYRLGLDFIIVEHMSVGFRFLGLGNTAQDNKVSTPFDRQQAAEEHFGQNFFTIVLGLHI